MTVIGIILGPIVQVSTCLQGTVMAAAYLGPHVHGICMKVEFTILPIGLSNIFYYQELVLGLTGIMRY